MTFRKSVRRVVRRCKERQGSRRRLLRRSYAPDMNVSLTPELEALVQSKVASGLYNNQSEVVREALRLLAEQDQMRQAHLARLREALDLGLQEADRGELFDGPEVVQEMREFLRRRSGSGEASD